MVLKHKDKDISSLEDIQKLKVKDLREILRFHAESCNVSFHRQIIEKTMKPISHKSKTTMIFNMNRP